jgi:hypothetical protein
VRQKDADLPGFAQNAAVYERATAKHTGVGRQETGRKVIRAINDHIIPSDQVGGVLNGEAFWVKGHLETGINLPQRLRSGNGLRKSQSVETVDDLTM